MSYIPTFPRFILALDFETSGYSPAPNFAAKHQPVSYGAAIVNGSTFEVIETLYREIAHDPERFEWSSEAEAIHGLTKEHLAKHGVPIEAAAVDLAELCMKYFGVMGPYDKIMLLGHRVSFDRDFLRVMMDTVDMELPIDSVLIDSATLGAVMIEIAGSENIFNAIGLPPRTKHNSMQDILYTVEAVKYFKTVFANGLRYELSQAV